MNSPPSTQSECKFHKNKNVCRCVCVCMCVLMCIFVTFDLNNMISYSPGDQKPEMDLIRLKSCVPSGDPR